MLRNKRPYVLKHFANNKKTIVMARIITTRLEDTAESTAHFRARVYMMPSGTTVTIPVREGSRGPLYQTLFETAHGKVLMKRPQYDRGRRRLDKEAVIVTFRFPKKYGLALTKALYAEETDEIMSYFKTRKEETVWK